ncbi:DeoR/GlpR family DNA-binding transcription regulator [Tropicimonas sediminicola]|uniref:Transcriptional regulator, DeoR family n=1 Tax=Tropicimonas sediminicola TaxID=1031541 RepID=A0A239IBS6_9RHOB|nr:DeoR/GlpR family DNA-binding transcription regulator [Tropicimonas sediminicola]SNS90513.1 transcriptional regulator, DeoR family [Tropicimonas sediminicola]
MTTGSAERRGEAVPLRLKKSERRRQILLELKLQPHVRNGDLAERFGVSSETIRRDFDALSGEGLIQRATGGAYAPAHGHHPSLDERSAAHVAERDRIGRRAAALVADGETLMVDSGSTTIAFARALAILGTRCTVLTNSIPVAMTLATGEGIAIRLCPGDYLPAESALVGTDTLDFIDRFNVDRCFIGASAISAEGPSEAVQGFAAVKRRMLKRAACGHLLIGSAKFGRKGLARVAGFADLDSIVVDRAPEGELAAALAVSGTDILVAQ